MVSVQERFIMAHIQYSSLQNLIWNKDSVDKLKVELNEI
jgi:hypothetical protein